MESPAEQALFVVVCPDKFRGSATSRQVAEAIEKGVKRAIDCEVWAHPMADGGEGTLEVVGGTPMTTSVSGPLGRKVTARWRFLEDQSPPTALIEMAEAAGRALLPKPIGDQCIEASTRGVGELILAAAQHGAKRIVIAVGGSCTTDGGFGAVEILRTQDLLPQIQLVVACDVETLFLDAAKVFGPQKGASSAQVLQLTNRLEDLATYYQKNFGKDVTQQMGSGAAGGLAGGLAALGAQLEKGGMLIAELIGLPELISRADLVITGEGRLDPPSFHGKVVGTVVSLAKGKAPVLCIAGQIAKELDLKDFGIESISIKNEFGVKKSYGTTLYCLEESAYRYSSVHFHSDL